MAVSYSTTLRTARLTAIITALGSAAYVEIRSGTRPANPGTAATGTLLATLPLSATPGVASGATLTFNAITSDSSADNTGTATWFRTYNATGPTAVIDGDVGTSGSDMNLNTTSIVSGGPVAISSWVITTGNA